MKQMDPSISVIIPCFNTGHYLKEALFSVVNQTFTNWEVIIVDDGSTDNTRDIAAEFKDSRIQYIFQKNRGLSAARNTGIRAATSEYIALLDADDIWKINYLEKMINVLNDHSEEIACYCGFIYIDPEGNQIGMPQLRVVPTNKFSKVILKQNWLIPSSVIFRRQVIDEVGFFDESLHAVEDWDMWMKMSTKGSFVCVPQYLVKYRLHNTNMSKDPFLMVSSHLNLIENKVGPPDGDPSDWTELKKMYYRCFYNQSAERYIEYGDLNLGTKYFLDMLDIAPENGSKMGVWRSLIRLHLPVEIRHAPGVVEWETAEQDVNSLLGILEKNEYRTITKSEKKKLKASAEIALAREAVEVDETKRALGYLWRSINSNQSIIIKRQFWGTLARGIFKINNN